MPSAPGQVISTRETDTSVLIQWAPPKEPNNLIGYYIDQCVKGSKDWTSANHKPHKSTKYVFSQTKTHRTAEKCLFVWSLMVFTCESVPAGLLLVVWPKEKPMCSVSRLSMSWVLVMNPRSLPLWLLRLPSVSIIFFIINDCGDDDDDYLLCNISLLDMWWTFWWLWWCIIIVIISIKIQCCLFSRPLCSLWHRTAELWRAFNGSELEEASSLWRSKDQGVLCGQKTQWNNHVEGGSYPTTHRKTL